MKDAAKSSTGKAFAVPAIIMVVMALVLFLPAGSLRFWEGWVYWAGFSLLTFFIAAYFLKHNPVFLSRRMQHGEHPATKKPPAIMNLFFAGYLIPGFDFRFHWSDVPAWVVIVSNAIVFMGYLLVFLVFKENSYASSVIQVEKDQPVITTGPYAFVRHPMYLGLLLMFIFTPLALGSYWAIPFFLLTLPMNIIRIQGEEEVLLRDLPGYKEYCNHTRYRLIPSIW